MTGTAQPIATTLQSTQDASVNFVFEMGAERLRFEARFVRRSSDYVVVYLSSQSGCRQLCRMCHLTATGQVQATDAGRDDFLAQGERVLEWYDAHESPAPVVHFNFMARGEPLANRNLLDGSVEILTGLGALARQRGLYPRFLLSTILPASLADRDLADCFPVIQPEIYYSIYTLDPAFRRRWLPRAIDPEAALEQLRSYQGKTRKLLKLHWAFIEGENDRLDDVAGICDWVRRGELRVDVNIVRYNPHGPRLGREPPEEVVRRNVAFLAEQLPEARVRVVPRVGFDVHASCGMFVDATT